VISKKKEPQSKRRWVIVQSATGKPTIGNDQGITSRAKAERLSDSYLMDTTVVAHHVYYNLPDPDQEEE
jgi:hypothetical protein